MDNSLSVKNKTKRNERRTMQIIKTALAIGSTARHRAIRWSQVESATTIKRKSRLSTGIGYRHLKKDHRMNSAPRICNRARTRLWNINGDSTWLSRSTKSRKRNEMSFLILILLPSRGLSTYSQSKSSSQTSKHKPSASKSKLWPRNLTRARRKR